MTDCLPPPDEAIIAIRVVRGILDGDLGPWQFPASAVRGMAVLFIGLLRANAAERGIMDTCLQEDFVREWLDSTHQAATLVALQHDPAGAAGE